MKVFSTREMQDDAAKAAYECAGICILVRPIKIYLHRNNVGVVCTRVAERLDEKPRSAVFMNETAPVSYQQASFTTQWNIDPFLRDVPFHELITFHVVQDCNKTLATQCHVRAIKTLDRAINS